jgi:cell division septation protein DedD
MASRGKRGAGERVLEGRHVIGLFLLMLVFSAVFFTLGYVMGRNQYDGQVRAANTSRPGADSFGASVAPVPGKNDPSPKHSAKPPIVTVAPDSTSSDSEWEQYGADKKKETGDHLRTSSPSWSSPTPSNSSVPNNTNARAAAVDTVRSGLPPGYSLQVTAVRKESDAFDLARRLKMKKFPAFVIYPQGNKYYRVQVGPYADLKSAEAAKKGLEGAGFRAIVKHG